MVLRVRPTPIRFPTNIPHTPLNNKPLLSKPSVFCPLGAIFYLGIMPRVKLLKKSALVLTTIREKACYIRGGSWYCCTELTQRSV